MPELTLLRTQFRLCQMCVSCCTETNCLFSLNVRPVLLQLLRTVHLHKLEPASSPPPIGHSLLHDLKALNLQLFVHIVCGLSMCIRQLMCSNHLLPLAFCNPENVCIHTANPKLPYA